MKLEELGLKQLGKRKPVIIPSDLFYVIVHPFFTDDNPSYLCAIKKLIHEEKNPILTLEWGVAISGESKDFDTLRDFRKLSPCGDRFFLPNDAQYSEPGCGWDDTARVIKMFNPKKIYLGGSMLGINSSGEYCNCVGSAYWALKERVKNIELNLAICDVRK
jgi:hypothetical protein